MINKKANNYLIKRYALQKVAAGETLQQRLRQIGANINKWWNDPKNEQIRDYSIGIGGGLLGGGILNKLFGGSFLRGGVTGGILGGAGTYAYRNMLGKQREAFSKEEAKRINAENEVNDLTTKNAELGKALKQTEQELGGALSQVDSLTNDNVSLNQRVADLENIEKDLEAEVKAGQLSAQEKQIALEKARQYISQLESDPTYQGLQNQYNEMSKQLTHANEQSRKQAPLVDKIKSISSSETAKLAYILNGLKTMGYSQDQIDKIMKRYTNKGQPGIADIVKAGFDQHNENIATGMDKIRRSAKATTEEFKK